MILTPSWFNLFRLQFTVLGYYVVNTVLTFMEMIRLAPKGSGKVRVRGRGRGRDRVRVGLGLVIRLAPKGSGKVRERPRAAQPMHGTSGATHTRPSTA